MRDYRNQNLNKSQDKSTPDKTPGKLTAELQALPTLPGVYIMTDGAGNIIYIGKAVNLKRRVKSYFQGRHKDNRKLERLVANIAAFRYIVTDTELEALLLECRLIKKHKPHYNAALKNDYQYPYIKITSAYYPELIVTQDILSDNARYYGPFSNSENVQRVSVLLRRIWGIRVCDKTIMPGLSKPPCLNFHLGKCSAPCAGNISSEEYLHGVKNAEKFLRGKHSETLRIVRTEMNLASESMQFEAAARYRDDLQELKRFAYKRKILLSSLTNKGTLVLTHSKCEDAAVIVYLLSFGRLSAKLKLEPGILESRTDQNSIDVKESIAKFLRSNLNGTFKRKRSYGQEEIDEILIIHRWLRYSKAKKTLTKLNLSRLNTAEYADFSLIANNLVNAFNGL